MCVEHTPVVKKKGKHHRVFFIRVQLALHGSFPCGSVGKESACNVGELGLIPGLGRSPGEGKGYLLQYGEFHGLYSPLGLGGQV